jgi:hypothetical protein
VDLINSLDEHSYFFYLDTLQEFYEYCCFFLNSENLDKKMHRHLKSFKQLAKVLHDLIDSLLSPDQELDIQKELFFAINNRFITRDYQIYVPVRYNDLKQVSYEFNNCLGSPMIKKQIDDKDFAIVVLKKENNFIAVMDLNKNFELNNIKAHFNVNFEDSEAIRNAWFDKIIPLLMKKSYIF